MSMRVLGSRAALDDRVLSQRLPIKLEELWVLSSIYAGEFSHPTTIGYHLNQAHFTGRKKVWMDEPEEIHYRLEEKVKKALNGRGHLYVVETSWRNMVTNEILKYSSGDERGEACLL